MSGKYVLSLAFVSPTPDDHWLNRLTAWASRHPFYHVELHLETVDKCFSIQFGDTARLRTKSMANPNYRIVSLSVSSHEYENCLQFCQAAETWDLGFDDPGMYRSWYGTGCCESSSQMVGRTFCSKIITEALQYGHVPEVEHLNPALATPSRLYAAVASSPRVVCSSVPFKRESLARLSSAMA